jgi:hypothetical protein
LFAVLVVVVCCVVVVAGPMGVTVGVCGFDAPALYFQKRDAARCIHVSGASALHFRIGLTPEELVQPMIVTQADAHDERRSAEFCEVGGFGLECFGICRCGDDLLGLREIASY